MRFVSDLRETFAATSGFLTGAQPGFFGRIGGSDTDFIMKYMQAKADPSRPDVMDRVMAEFDIVRHYNGYYDFDNQHSNIVAFYDTLLDAYYRTRQMFIVGGALLTHFLPTTIDKRFQVDTTTVAPAADRLFSEIDRRQPSTTFYPYEFTERLTLGECTLFRAFSTALAGSKVLVISPFERSIRANFSRRHLFFRNYAYPEFELVTYNTPITYSGLPDSFYPDRNWHATLERMRKELRDVSFDVALLACGSYAGPLGTFIADELGKKAVYVGGCLQLYFGVMGRRYENPYFLDQINAENFIYPIEKKEFSPYVSIGPETAKEAFGAYL